MTLVYHHVHTTTPHTPRILDLPVLPWSLIITPTHIHVFPLDLDLSPIILVVKTDVSLVGWI